MGWGATLLKLPEGVKTLDQIPDDFESGDVGSTEDVFSVLTNLFPDQTHEMGEMEYWDDQSHVQLFYDYKNTGVVGSIGVRSNGGDSTMEVLQKVCEALGLRLYDDQSNEIVNFDEVTHDSLRNFRDFKRRVFE